MAEVSFLNVPIEKVLLMPKFSPLAMVVSAISDQAFIGKSLYRVGEKVFLCLSKYKGKALERDGHAPYIAGVLWAADLSSALRVVNFDIERDAGVEGEVPEVFLPGEYMMAYEDVVEFLNMAESGGCLESATYRIATDGAFVYRSIESVGYAFYFRKPNGDRDMPFAVMKKLKSSD